MEFEVSCNTCKYPINTPYCKRCNDDRNIKDMVYVEELFINIPKKNIYFNYKGYEPSKEFIDKFMTEEFIKEEEFKI